jgi:zinc/manganese transport system permease protein
MNEAAMFLLAPFVICLILAGIHCYLGLHVLARGVIFVDLSLAQVAAVGISLGLLLGFEEHSALVYFIALLMTFIASAVFALARRHESRFSQEAIIGIVFALSSAAVVLLAEKMPHGMEHIKDLLAGQILWVTWGDVIRTAIIYSIVGLVHYVFRKQLLEASFNHKAEKTIFWDILFYALFGVVITSSVSIAGVLLVFSYLIVPSLISTFFFDTIKRRLFFGWTFGFVLSFIAIILSYKLDMPTGPFIVVCFASLPVLLLVATSVLPAKSENSPPLTH